MDAIGVIIGVVIVIAYIAAAIMFIRECETTSGTVWATIAAVGVGALLASFIEYLIAIAVIAIVLCILGAIFGG